MPPSPSLSHQLGDCDGFLRLQAAPPRPAARCDRLLHARQSPYDPRRFVSLCHRDGRAGRRSSRLLRHPASAVDLLRECRITAVAPSTSESAKVVIALFGDPPLALFAALLCCSAPARSRPARCRAERNWKGSVIVATIADAVIGPTPGIAASSTARLVVFVPAMIAPSISFTRPSSASSCANQFPRSAWRASAGTVVVSSPNGTATRSATRLCPEAR